MVQAGEDLRLPREPGEAVRVVCEGVRQDLQRDLAVELRIGGLPDLAHAALAEQRGDVVVAEAGADVEGHGSVCAEDMDLPLLANRLLFRGLAGRLPFGGAADFLGRLLG